ncbi:MAG: hypothetical protein WC969_03545 [Elusimicrobiota bacterium]|jgi:tetratricopeptide (TPR) repeat protein
MKTVGALLTLLLAAGPAWAAKPSMPSDSAVPAAGHSAAGTAREENGPRADDPVRWEVAAMVDLFYDLRIAEGLAAAKKLEDRHPEHPAGPFFQGIAYYQRILVETPISTASVRAFEERMARAAKLAGRAPADAPAWREYYLGAAYGFQARVSSLRRDWVSAMRDARKAVGHVKKAVELDPDLEDAYLGLGMYHYFMARMPPTARPFAYLLMGLWGDREKGIAEMKRSAERGSVAVSEALAVLAFVDTIEGRGREADLGLERLMKRHPHNPAFRLWRATLLQRAGHWKEAAALADPGPWAGEVDPAARETSRAVGHYIAAEAFLMLRDASGAAAHLEALERLSVPERMRGWTALRRANLLDLQGRRADALAGYRALDGRLKPLARGFIAAPFPEGPKDLLRLRWPLNGLPSDDTQ